MSISFSRAKELEGVLSEFLLLLEATISVCVMARVLFVSVSSMSVCLPFQ
jgi:hypothetical protein